jgi:hypothetical protein
VQLRHGKQQRKKSSFCSAEPQESDAPMTYAEPSERAALIDGFRALADYLEANQDVPVASCADMYTFPPNGNCAAERAEIDAIAEMLGSQPRETARGRHYGVSRSFGPVEYRAVTICDHHCHSEE